MQTQTLIVEKLISRIVETVHPLRIVLFGSVVMGNMGPDSDIDLMVVMPEGTHRRHTAQKIYRDIQGIEIPFDVVVATPGDLTRYGNSPGLIYREVLREGQEVYVA
jgi:predicted nucleotidyltransferase